MSGHKRVFDAIVVGAGPSGLYTARTLAQEGYEVRVLEAKEEVGKDIICTGIVGTRVFEEFGLSRSSVLREIQQVRFLSPLGRPLLYTHPFPFAMVVDRERFDRGLLCEAQSRGVQVMLGARAIGATTHKEYVEIHIRRRENEDGVVKGKVLVVATGVDCELSRAVGLGYPRRFSRAVQWSANGNTREPVTILLGREIARGGFGWVVPAEDGRVRVGLISDENPISGLKRMASLFFKTKGDIEPRLKPIAQGAVSRTYGERMLVVGEAAGQVKTTTGGGLYFGILCAAAAGATIADALKRKDVSRNRLRQYEERWKGSVGREIRLGRFFRTISRGLKDEQIEEIFVKAENNGILDYVRERADFDWHGDFLLKFLKRLVSNPKTG
jgi:digeranylgeranylglycerophospholipid reductase